MEIMASFELEDGHDFCPAHDDRINFVGIRIIFLVPAIIAQDIRRSFRRRGIDQPFLIFGLEDVLIELSGIVGHVDGDLFRRVMAQDKFQALTVRQSPIIKLPFCPQIAPGEAVKIDILEGMVGSHENDGINQAQKNDQDIDRPQNLGQPAERFHGRPNEEKAFDRQDQEGGIDEIQMAPRVIDDGPEHDDGQEGNEEPGQKEDVVSFFPFSKKTETLLDDLDE